MELLIWQARKNQNVSLKKLSKMTGISKSALSNYENGIRDPGIHRLEKIAKALNTTISNLYNSDYK